MFGHSYFGAAMDGPSYFGPAVGSVVPTPTPVDSEDDSSGGGGSGGTRTVQRQRYIQVIPRRREIALEGEVIGYGGAEGELSVSLGAEGGVGGGGSASASMSALRACAGGPKGSLAIGRRLDNRTSFLQSEEAGFRDRIATQAVRLEAADAERSQLTHRAERAEAAAIEAEEQWILSLISEVTHAL